MIPFLEVGLTMGFFTSFPFFAVLKKQKKIQRKRITVSVATCQTCFRLSKSSFLVFVRPFLPSMLTNERKEY
jgi:hypothetical protein